MESPKPSKRKYVGIILAVAVVAGIIIAIVAGGDSQKKANTNPTKPAKPFAPLSTDEKAFKATITNGNTKQGVVESDGKGTTTYIVTTKGQTTQIIYTPTAYYLCQAGGACYKYEAVLKGPITFDPSNYLYPASKLNGYKTDAEYIGKQNCPAGSCDVWKVKTKASELSFFVDPKTNQISQIESVVNGKTSKINYQFVSTSIAIPANAKPAPTH